MADDVLTPVVNFNGSTGMINLDFSDIKTVMSEMGKEDGTGEAQRR